MESSSPRHSLKRRCCPFSDPTIFWHKPVLILYKEEINRLLDCQLFSKKTQCHCPHAWRVNKVSLYSICMESLSPRSCLCVQKYITTCKSACLERPPSKPHWNKEKGGNYFFFLTENCFSVHSPHIWVLRQQDVLTSGSGDPGTFFRVAEEGRAATIRNRPKSSSSLNFCMYFSSLIRIILGTIGILSACLLHIWNMDAAYHYVLM